MLLTPIFKLGPTVNSYRCPESKTFKVTAALFSLGEMARWRLESTLINMQLSAWSPAEAPNHTS